MVAAAAEAVDHVAAAVDHAAAAAVIVVAIMAEDTDKNSLFAFAILIFILRTAVKRGNGLVSNDSSKERLTTWPPL